MKRKSLSRNQRVQIWDTNKGICHICGLPIWLGEKWDADHVIPRGLTGSDALDEYKPAHVDCHKCKTKSDNRTVKKAVRVRAKHVGVEKTGGKAMPGTKRSRLKRGFDGVVRDRETGEPVNS
jgi:5-methylcytosine-specific restriction endonuclease McrA